MRDPYEPNIQIAFVRSLAEHAPIAGPYTRRRLFSHRIVEIVGVVVAFCLAAYVIHYMGQGEFMEMLWKLLWGKP